MNSSIMIFIVVAAVAVYLIMNAYRSGDIDPFGIVKPSRKVEKYFKHHELPKQYNYYYYSESPGDIYALVGLEPGYAVSGDAWHEFEPEEETLEQLLAQLVSYKTEAADGYLLFAPGNSPMGIYYSPLPNPSVQVNAHQEVIFPLELPVDLKDDEL